MSDQPSRVERTIRRLHGDRRAADRPGDGRGRRASDHQPMRGWKPAMAIALGVALLDWGVKFAVIQTLPVEHFREIVPGAVALWHVQNPAMILGLWGELPLAARKVLAVVAAVVGALVLIQIVGRAHRLEGRHQRWAWLFVGLICGGMMGNLGERLLHWWVTDYLSFRWGELWLPPGNVADIALFLSIPLAVPIIAFEMRARARRGRAAAATQEPAAHTAAR